MDRWARCLRKRIREDERTPCDGAPSGHALPQKPVAVEDRIASTVVVKVS